MDIARYPLVSDQINKTELQVIVRELQAVLAKDIAGDVVEFGCYVGTTSLFLQRVVATRRQLHVYDSFAGLPPKTFKDQSVAGDQYQSDELRATKNQLITNFKQAGLPLPAIHKGWFSDMAPSDVPPAICFAYLDGDFYESITDSLRLVWPRLSRGACVIVDDYYHEALPGAQRAVDDWLVNHPAHIRVQASLAILRPKV